MSLSGFLLGQRLERERGLRFLHRGEADRLGTGRGVGKSSHLSWYFEEVSRAVENSD